MKRIEKIATYIITALFACFADNLADLHARHTAGPAETQLAAEVRIAATAPATTEMAKTETTNTAIAKTAQKSPIKIAEGVTIDKDVHNFGEVITGSGPLSCTFTITNRSDKPIVIFSVASSCGCTDVKWTHEPIRPGESGTISATYSNDEGPIAFDKNLTVYFSNVKKPYTLKLRGICKAPKLSKEEIYKRRVGSIGLVELEANTGQIKRGLVKSASIHAANMSDSPVKVEFTELTDGLSVAMREKGTDKIFSDGMIPAGEEFEIVFSVKADGTRWGKSKYTAMLSVSDDNGNSPSPSISKYGTGSNSTKQIRENSETGKGGVENSSDLNTTKHEIKVFASIVDNFDSLTTDQKHKGPNPSFKTSSYSFGIIDSGTTIHAEFEMENIGNGTLRIYKCDTDARRYSHSDIYALKPGEKGKFRVHVDTSLMPKGETDIIVTLTTNSPLRPVVNLFISGYIR